jgi:trans-2-enoyl-CoA reductase
MNPSTSKSVVFKSFGKPDEVLELVEQNISEPATDEVLIKLIASPIVPGDFGGILGKYGVLKELPAIAGATGIGEIVQVGEAVESIEVGQWVRVPEELGVWQEICTAKAENLNVLPSGLDHRSACIASVNPQTAIRMLEDFESLEAGDWVIQNAANSNVGIAVIQYAKKLGLKTVNLVRREELTQPLLEIGADVVVTEETFNPREIETITQGDRPKLAINSVGGKSALNILNALRPGGTHVTIGAMTFEPVRFPTRQLIFDDIKIRGFWYMVWQQNHTPEESKALDDQVYSLIADGTFNFPVEATYPLSQFKEALKHASKPRFGTILLTGD